nr:hypothetical protein [Tanacetum cinerariifolium]
EDMTEAENLIEHEDETVPASVHEVGESSTAPFLREDIDGLLPGFMRRDINSLLVGLLLFQDDCVVAKRCMHWSRRKEKQTTSIMVDPLNPSPPASESEPEDMTEAENLIEHEDETVPASVHELRSNKSRGITTEGTVEEEGV